MRHGLFFRGISGVLPTTLEAVSKSNAQPPFTPWKQRKERQVAEDAENTSKYKVFLLSPRTLRLRDLCVCSTAHGTEGFLK